MGVTSALIALIAVIFDDVRRKRRRREAMHRLRETKYYYRGET
jgi:hypothetical protein